MHHTRAGAGLSGPCHKYGHAPRARFVESRLLRKAGRARPSISPPPVRHRNYERDHSAQAEITLLLSNDGRVRRWRGCGLLVILIVRPHGRSHCGSGGIGRRAGLRSLWDLVPWGFKSPFRTNTQAPNDGRQRTLFARDLLSVEGTGGMPRCATNVRQIPAPRPQRGGGTGHHSRVGGWTNRGVCSGSQSRDSASRQNTGGCLLSWRHLLQPDPRRGDPAECSHCHSSTCRGVGPMNLEPTPCRGSPGGPR